MSKRKPTNLFLSAWLVLLNPTLGSAMETCILEFSFVAGNEIGTVVAGDALSGTINFTVEREMRLDSETQSYFVDGLITLSGPGAGLVTGEPHILHVVRNDHTWDYISIVAENVGGNLGGETRYFDPMVFTLADEPNTLQSFDLPSDADEWNFLTRTQKFQFHTPDGNQIFHGLVTNLQGSCTAG